MNSAFLQKNDKTKKILFLIFLLSVFISLICGFVKQHNLDFHSRDYPFYIQFISKLTDSNLTNQYTLNPNGHNAINYIGIDGKRSFHQTIHFEPIKYILSLIYLFNQSPLFLFFITSFIYFSPILYISLFYKTHNKEDCQYVIFFALLFAFYPSTIQAALHDLRPFSFLTPFFILSILSIHFKRPAIETTVFVILLLLSREESLFFSIIVIAYSVFYREIGEENTNRVKFLTPIYLVFLFSNSLYFVWIENEYKSGPYHFYGLIFASIFIASLFLLKKGSITAIFKTTRINQNAFPVIAYCLIFIPLTYHYLRVNGFAFSHKDILFSPRYNMYFVFLLILSFISWPIIKTSSKRRLLKALRVFFFISMTLSLFFLAYFVAIKSPNVIDKYKESNLIHQTRQVTNKYKTHILCDYATYQAFYDYENVIVYNRLPYYLVESYHKRYYPNNKNILQKLLREDVEYIVISRENIKIINDLLIKSNTKAPIYIENTSLYHVIRLR